MVVDAAKSTRRLGGEEQLHVSAGHCCEDATERQAALQQRSKAEGHPTLWQSLRTVLDLMNPPAALAALQGAARLERPPREVLPLTPPTTVPSKGKRCLV